MSKADDDATTIDRRRLFRAGAGAITLAALGSLPALATVPNEDPIIALWGERNRLLAEANRMLKRVDALSRADDARWRETERNADDTAHQAYLVEGRICALTPASPQGWAIQAQILMNAYRDNLGGMRGDGGDLMIAERMAGRLA